VRGQLYDITSGRIIFEGQDISTWSARRMRPLRREIQMIFRTRTGR
jgi:ABC-type microcin C transport system duplicated ATPase subunit YejF